MIDIRIIHPATATEQQMVVEATEQLCEGVLHKFIKSTFGQHCLQ